MTHEVTAAASNLRRPQNNLHALGNVYQPQKRTLKLITHTEGHIFVLSLNRPDVRNCIDAETAQLLHDAWLRFRDDPDLWVAVLTSTDPRAFCAGADLASLDELGPGTQARPSHMRRFAASGPGFIGYTRQTDIFKPILAAVNGDALAGGLELACLADLRIAEEHARFGVACRRFGVPLIDGGTQRLPRIIGMGHAMDLILTGRFIDAHEAHRMGLANEVVPSGTSLQRAMELARTLCTFPQGAMRADKQSALMGYGKPLDEGLRIEAMIGMSVLQDPDMHEGAKAFKERRPPEFTQED